MFDEFYKITGFDLETYFNRFVSFISNQSQLIIDFYSGSTEEMDRDAYEEFKYLSGKIDYILDLFDINIQRFNTVDFWQLMEYSDDIKIKLESIGKFWKFARSSVDGGSFTNKVTLSLPLKENQTLEQMLKELGSTDKENDWVDVALKNNLIQEDYTTDQNVLIKINFKNNFDFKITSCVGSLEGDNIKGVDINKKIAFVDDDFKILSNDNTLNQNIDILANLGKNDNPEFQSNGINHSLVVGTNMKTIAIPSVVRQLFDTFATDDLVKEIRILSVETEEDNIYMNYNIFLHSGEEKTQTLSI